MHVERSVVVLVHGRLKDRAAEAMRVGENPTVER
jgi:hypothetical protein